MFLVTCVLTLSFGEARITLYNRVNNIIQVSWC